ncbi:MAG: ABC transporter permease [Verrucomicrobiota bacterium]
MSADTKKIPEQGRIPWSIAISVSWAGLRRRLLRGLITMAGVVLAISFLTYMLVTESLTQALIALNNDELNILLQEAGVDIFSGGGTDEMMILLIGLSLFTSLVGILNSMIMAVAERVREIGTLKCLGARDSFIIKTYFIESSIQGIIGALLGTVGGCIVAILVSAVNYGSMVITNLPYGSLLRAMVVSCLTGAALAIIAAILPASMAAKKQPVDALRVEE